MNVSFDSAELVLRVVMLLIMVVQLHALNSIIRVMRALVVELGTARWELSRRAASVVLLTDDLEVRSGAPAGE